MNDLQTPIDLSKEFNKHGMMITPSVAEEIIDSSLSTTKIINKIIDEYDEGDILEEDKINSIINKLNNEKEQENKKENSKEQKVNKNKNNLKNKKFIDPKKALNKINKTFEEKKKNKIENRKETLNERYPELYDKLFNRKFPPCVKRNNNDPEYTISNDISGNSRGKGDYKDYKSLFKYRNDTLLDIIKERVNTYTVKELNNITGTEDVTVSGLVWNKFTSNSGNYVLELEDSNISDNILIVFTDDNIKPTFEKVILDELVAVSGTYDEDRGIMYGDEILFPEIPRKRNRNKPNRFVQGAFISDIHIGSEDFYPNYWNKFVDWVRTTESIEYIFVAGDAVEGIGVYPNQDEELEVTDIYDQYALTGKMFEYLPDDVQIFLSVGNHDSVRLAEPQPKLDEKFTKYFSDNVEFVGNPAIVTVENIDILLYHGMSINALDEAIPGVSMNNPEEIMKIMLEKRHLAPLYGKNVRLAPEEEDYLIIDDVPDILHTGHVHKYGHDKYNNVAMVNTATWQGQTDFQKSKGVEPDVGYFSTIDFSNLKITKHNINNKN